MTKIAAFGDSFAAKSHLEFNDTQEMFVKEIYDLCNRKYNKQEFSRIREILGSRYKSWMDVLSADTFGGSGSDIYFSYNQFIHNHMSYDKCIFVITSPVRFSSNINGWRHCGSSDDAREKAEWSPNKKYYSVLADTFEHIFYKDLDRIELINQAMLDNIKTIRPDTIFIDSFPVLKNIYELELKAWNTDHIESQDYSKYIDLRICHMTNENNFILGNYILQNLDKSGYLDLLDVDWRTPTLEDKSYYLPQTHNIFDLLLS